MPIEEQLLQWKREIEAGKTEKAQLEGQRTELLRRLNEEYQHNSLATAEAQIKTIEANLETLKQQLEKGVQEYKEKFGR